VDPERQFYDPTILSHHHFFNVDTGELTDIPMEGLSLDVKRELPPGTEQVGIEVVIQVRDQSPE
jgi:Fur family iron response transcriptional regulator